MSKPKLDYGYGYNELNSIRIVWCIDDVRHVLSELPEKYKNEKLTDDECMEILDGVDRNHDASIGIAWDTIEWATEDYINDR
tara:strand:- start:353 stop:598 length:246 start_codon:yes stop_codon:yes gene_type:complete